MKRISNDVSVQTICYVIGGNQHIKIVDYDNDYTMSQDNNGTQGTVVYDGLLKDSYRDSYKLVKYFRSKCHGIIIENNNIIFQVFTKYEQY